MKAPSAPSSWMSADAPPGPPNKAIPSLAESVLKGSSSESQPFPVGRVKTHPSGLILRDRWVSPTRQECAQPGDAHTQQDGQVNQPEDASQDPEILARDESAPEVNGGRSGGIRRDHAHQADGVGEQE